VINQFNRPPYLNSPGENDEPQPACAKFRASATAILCFSLYLANTRLDTSLGWVFVTYADLAALKPSTTHVAIGFSALNRLLVEAWA